MHAGVGAVRGGAVIALQIILQHQLPVRIHPIGLFVSHFCIWQVIGTQWLPQVLQRGEKIGSIRVTVDKHQAHVNHHAGLFEPMAGHIEIRTHVHFPRGLQTAVGVVNPAMVGADKGLAIACHLLTNPGTAMSAYIHQRTHFATVIAHDNQGVLANIQ